MLVRVTLTFLGKELKNMTNLQANCIVVRYTLVDESKQHMVLSGLQTYFHVEHDNQYAVDSLFRISDEHTFVVTTDVLNGKPVEEIELPGLLEQYIDSYSIELFINSQLQKQLNHGGEPFEGVVNTAVPALAQSDNIQSTSLEEVQLVDQSLLSNFAEEPEKEDTSVEGIVNSLLPDAEYIFERVSAPLSVEPKMLLNRDIMLLKSQYDASLNTINMLISDHLTNVLRSGTLDQDLRAIANKISSNPTAPIRDYQSALEDRNKMSEDLYEQVKHIQSAYAERMEEWIASEIKKLEEQYRAEHPDDSEARIAAYIAEHIDDINTISARVEETRKAAEESIMRAIAEHSDRKELVPVMRFLKTKDQYQASLSEVVDAWKHEQELAARPAPIVAAPQPAVVEPQPVHQPEPDPQPEKHEELSHVEKHDILTEDEFEDDIDVEDLAKEVENEYDKEDHHPVIEEKHEEPASPFLEPQPDEPVEDVNLSEIDAMLANLDELDDFDEDEEEQHSDHGQMIPPTVEHAPVAEPQPVHAAAVPEQPHTEQSQSVDDLLAEASQVVADTQPAIEKALGKEIIDRGEDDNLDDDLFANAKSAVSGLDLNLPSAITNRVEEVNADEDDEDMDFDDDDFAEYEGHDDDDDDDDEEDHKKPAKSGLSMKQIGLISGIVIAIIAVIALVIMFLNPFGKKPAPASNEPTTTQQAPANNNSNSGDSGNNTISTAPLASVGDTLVISIGGKEKNVKVTEVRSDGSVIVEDSEGTKLEIPYDKLKAALDK